MKTKYFYIYNPYQAKFFIDMGLTVLSISKGAKGDVYHKFLRDKKSEKIFMEWKRKKYGNMAV